MALSNTFPYVTGTHANESDQHIKLKGLAVYWLLSRGYCLDDIQQEYHVQTESGGYGHTDIYAERDGHEVFIECETPPESISRGGRIPARRGEAVFMFTENGIKRIVQTTVEGTSRHSSADPTVRRKVIKTRDYAPLPLLDLSSFKEG